MYMEGFRQIRLLEKLGDGWFGGWVVGGGGGRFFVNIKDWQSQSIKDVPVLKVSLVEI